MRISNKVNIILFKNSVRIPLFCQHVYKKETNFYERENSINLNIIQIFEIYIIF